MAQWVTIYIEPHTRAHNVLNPAFWQKQKRQTYTQTPQNSTHFVFLEEINEKMKMFFDKEFKRNWGYCAYWNPEVL